MTPTLFDLAVPILFLVIGFAVGRWSVPSKEEHVVKEQSTKTSNQ